MSDLTPEERTRIYEEEKARLEAQVKPPAPAQKQKRSIGCGTIILLLVGLLGTAVIALLIENSSSSRSPAKSSVEPPSQSTTPADTSIIDYTVLRRWTPGKSGMGMEVLVSPNSTKLEVMELAYKLRDDFRRTGFFVLSIFDSKEAWENRQNESYPEAKYWKHYLVQVFCPAISGQAEIEWVAKDREDPKR